MQSKFKTIGLRGKKKRLDHGRIGLFSGLIQNFQWASLPLSYGSPPPRGVRTETWKKNWPIFASFNAIPAEITEKYYG